jgi:general secretion pathway protein F
MSSFPTFSRFFRALPEAARAVARGIFGGWDRARLGRFDSGLFCRQLASMLAGNIPLPQALAYLADEFAPDIAERIGAARSAVAEGRPLSEALAELPDAWVPATWRAAVAAGERSGRLPEVLEMLASESETVEEAARQARGLLVYPLTVLCIAGLVVSVVFWKVIPMFTSLYGALRAELPLGTRAMIAAARFLSTPASFVLGGLVLYVLLVIFVPRLALPLRGPITRLLLRLPVVSSLWLSIVELRFARSLRIMVDAGVPLPEALDRSEQVVGDSRAGVELVRAARRIREGELPSEALKGVGAIAPAFVWFIAGTEQRGDFLDITAAMAEAAQEKLRTRIQLVLRVVEPVSIVCLGLIIGFVVIHIYWPMFKLPTLVN